MKATLLPRTEEQECIALVEYLNILKLQRKITTYTHIPNETYTTSFNQKMKNKRMGVASGFPDYVILGREKIIFLEMKREKGGVVSIEQRIWIEELDRYPSSISAVCRGFKEAEVFLKEVLK